MTDAVWIDHGVPNTYVRGSLKFANSGRPAAELSERLESPDQRPLAGSTLAGWWTPTVRHECDEPTNQCRNQTIHASTSGEGPRQPECQAPGLLGIDLQMGFGQTCRRATAPAEEISSLVSSSSMVPSSGMVPSTSLVPSLSSTSLAASSAVDTSGLSRSILASQVDSGQHVSGEASPRVVCRHSAATSGSPAPRSADEDFDAVIDIEWQGHLATLGEELARSKNKGGTYWRAWFDAMSLEAEPILDTTVVESDEGSPPFTEDDRRSRPALRDDHSTGGREESKLVEGDGDVGDDPDFHEISYEYEDLMREERARERLRDERAQVDWKKRQAQPSG